MMATTNLSRGIFLAGGTMQKEYVDTWKVYFGGRERTSDGMQSVPAIRLSRSAATKSKRQQQNMAMDDE